MVIQDLFLDHLIFSVVLLIDVIIVLRRNHLLTKTYLTFVQLTAMVLLCSVNIYKILLKHYLVKMTTANSLICDSI